MYDVYASTSSLYETGNKLIRQKWINLYFLNALIIIIIIIIALLFCWFSIKVLFSNIVLNDLWHHLVFAQDKTWE